MHLDLDFGKRTPFLVLNIVMHQCSRLWLTIDPRTNLFRFTADIMCNCRRRTESGDLAKLNQTGYMYVKSLVIWYEWVSMNLLHLRQWLNAFISQPCKLLLTVGSLSLCCDSVDMHYCTHGVCGMLCHVRHFRHKPDDWNKKWKVYLVIGEWRLLAGWFFLTGYRQLVGYCKAAETL